jgi:hypothetical protein
MFYEVTIGLAGRPRLPCSTSEAFEVTSPVEVTASKSDRVPETR